MAMLDRKVGGRAEAVLPSMDPAEANVSWIVQPFLDVPSLPNQDAFEGAESERLGVGQRKAKHGYYMSV